MKRLLAGLAVAAFAAAPAFAADPKLTADIEKDYRSHLEQLFIWFHQHPELSFKETNTAARMAQELKALGGGLEITENVGGHGIVAVLKNGAGPTVLIRADMDGLPLEEKSGLPYASKVRQIDADGVEQPVMHACGHDTHITALIGTAKQLIARKSQWKGTVVFVVQPAEERVGGAKAMLKDGLYTRFPKPDYAIGFHDTSGSEAGKVLVASRLMLAGSDSVDIKVRGVGAHGAMPHLGVDPVLIASQIVVSLQSVISRSKDPSDRGVITVGTIHGGTKRNIIPDEANLELTVRSDTPEVRQKLLDGIKRVAENTARALGAPDSLLPVVTVRSEETAPPTLNDMPTALRMRSVLTKYFEPGRVMEPQQGTMAADDFAMLAEPVQPGVKGFFIQVGGTAKERMSNPPPHHSPIFRIEPEPVIRTGIEAMVVTTMELLKK